MASSRNVMANRTRRRRRRAAARNGTRAIAGILFSVMAFSEWRRDVKLWRTGRYVRLGALAGACSALRVAAAVFVAFYFALVKPAVFGRLRPCGRVLGFARCGGCFRCVLFRVG